MGLLEKEMAPQVTQHPGARPKGKDPMDTKRIPPAGAAFQTAHEKDTHPHACWNGWVFLGYTDPETDEERSEAIPCRRCGEAE